MSRPDPQYIFLEGGSGPILLHAANSGVHKFGHAGNLDAIGPLTNFL